MKKRYRIRKQWIWIYPLLVMSFMACGTFQPDGLTDNQMTVFVAIMMIGLIPFGCLCGSFYYRFNDGAHPGRQGWWALTNAPKPSSEECMEMLKWG